jgi:hypothetical protein
MISLITNAQTLEVPDQIKNKNVTILIPYLPGGDSDALHRFMGEQVKKLTGINIVYINKAGAGTIIGSNEAASRPADGLTLYGSDGSTHVFNPAMGIANHTDPKLLQPVSVFALTPQFMYVAANSSINSVKDLVAYIKANPKSNFGCNGTQVCLYQKAFFNSIGADKVNDINFKSSGEVIISLVQGDIVTFTSGATTGFVHVQSGKIKPIGVSQFLTAIAISLVFVIISFGMKQIVKSISEMKWTDVPKIPVFFTLISLAIATSAWIFFKFKKEIDGLGFLTILKVLFLGFALGVIGIVAAIAVRIMKGIDWKTTLLVPVFFVLMAAAITGAAWLFSKFQKNIDRKRWKEKS